MRHMDWTWRWVLAVPPGRLWPAVADTDRFNRYVGLPPLAYRPLPAGDGVPRQEATMRRRGIAVTWEEFPFEFEEPRYFSVFRRYRSGPLAEMHVAVDLLAHERGTELVYRVRARPRVALAAWPVRVEIGVFAFRAFNRAFRAIERALVRDQEPLPDPPALARSAGPALSGALSGVSGAEALIGYLLGRSDKELHRIRPFLLGTALGLSRDAALTLCVHATRRGVLDAVWSLLCPHCRGAKAEAPALSALDFEGHCDACGLDFLADFDRLTELVFRLAPRWKTLEAGEYCIGGPRRTPHIAVQFRLGAGATSERPLSLSLGTYRIRSTAGTPILLTVADEGASAATIPIVQGASRLEEVSVRPGGVLQVQNASPRESLVSIERTEWADGACTAAYVSAVQAHRDLFSKDVLAPGVAVQVGWMTILFTDLKDSTALYGSIGDAPAFGLVRKHFDAIGGAIRTHHGAVVKTVGDAVMACFLDPADGIRAALEMHGAIDRLGAREGRRLVLKVGMHAGPCFAVTMNGTLDYFGSTVNLASRIQSNSKGRDIVLDEALAGTPAIDACIRSLQSDRVEVALRGFEAKVSRLVRVIVPDPASDGPAAAAATPNPIQSR
jgi:class 3 adenylate cyclase